jgi:ADP-heptose:LPS heptosyltransferase
MANKVLFMIRGKLGDSLIAFSVLQEYIRQHPADEVHLILRRNYAKLVAGEKGFRLVPYLGRWQIVLWFWLRRLFTSSYDAFVVLWGFGEPVVHFGKLVKARRMIYLDGRYAELFPEFPPETDYERQVDHSWKAAELFSPGLAKPLELRIDSLRSLRKPGQIISICPTASAPERSLDSSIVAVLLSTLHHRYPEHELVLTVNPGEEHLLPADLPFAVTLLTFTSLQQIVDHYQSVGRWFGTDTGLFHLAAAMGVPCEVFFGPTCIESNIMPKQDVTGYKLSGFARFDCKIPCTRPVCLFQAICNESGDGEDYGVDATPAACPLRTFTVEGRLTNRRRYQGIDLE